MQTIKARRTIYTKSLSCRIKHQKANMFRFYWSLFFEEQKTRFLEHILSDEHLGGITSQNYSLSLSVPFSERGAHACNQKIIYRYIRFLTF